MRMRNATVAFLILFTAAVCHGKLETITLTINESANEDKSVQDVLNYYNQEDPVLRGQKDSLIKVWDPKKWNTKDQKFGDWRNPTSGELAAAKEDGRPTYVLSHGLNSH